MATPHLTGWRIADHPHKAPYDRVIATCSVSVVPPAWLEQVVPGGIIMTDVRGQPGGTVVRLASNDDGTASGRFLPSYVSFMLMRPGAETVPTVRPRPAPPDEMNDSISEVDPKLLQGDGHAGFVTQRHLR